MKHQIKFSITRNYLITALALICCPPALAHDPLGEEDGHAHNESHHNQSIQEYHEHDSRIDLANVRSLVTEFRKTGDDQHLDQAWLLLTSAMETKAHDPETLVVAAFVAQSRHNFGLAEELIKSSLALNAHNDEAWLLLASVHLVRGDAMAAESACRQLRRADPLVMLTCSSRVRLVRGNHTIALDRMRRVMEVIDLKRLPPATIAWSLSVAGDLAVAAGHTKTAEEFYRRSLTLAERTQVRAALVDVQLAESRHAEAWEVLNAGEPALPLLVRRFIVAKALGRLKEMQTELTKVEREFDRWISNEDWLHSREMARFYVDVVNRPNLARRLALINLSLQKEPEDIRLERRTGT